MVENVDGGETLIDNKKDVNKEFTAKNVKDENVQQFDTIILTNETESNPSLDEIPVWNYEDSLPKPAPRVRIADLSNLSARKIWGIVLVRLREEHYMSLHTAGGEIREISMVDNKLIAKVSQENLYNILTRAENYDKISSELKEINGKLSIEFVLSLPKQSEGVKNLPKIKELFGDFLQIKK